MKHNGKALLLHQILKIQRKIFQEKRPIFWQTQNFVGLESNTKTDAPLIAHLPGLFIVYSPT